MSIRRGRPPLDRDDATARLSLRLPSKQYAAATTRASGARLSRAEWIRRAVREALKPIK